MFSIQKFLGKDPKFFDLLEAAATEALNCANAVDALVKNSSNKADMHEVRKARQRCKDLTEEISELAVKTFVTVIEHEDIASLASSIYKVPKPIEKFAERYLISHELFGNGYAYQQLEIIKSATSTVLEMVKTLRKGMNSETLAKYNFKLQAAENEADNLEVELLRDLYKTRSNPVEVILCSDLYDLLERVIDRCRDCGNVIVHICHKNS